jgi:Flp pilus assembly protein protease CpaA
MFSISFYIFSLFLSYSDYKTFRIPNIIIGTMTLFLIIFGIFEDRLSLLSLVLPIIILLFFTVLMIFDKKLSIGGGDIKYYMVISIYLDIFSFSIFLIVTGLLQTLVLIFRQKVQKKRFVAMAPIIFCSVIITELLNFLGVFPKI